MTAGRPEPDDGVLEQLCRRIAGYGRSRAAVAFSGGVDSALVLAVAARALGASRVLAFTAVSPSLPAGELETARHVASSLGVVHRTVRTEELERDVYARNDAMRCFHCKMELYSTLRRVAALQGHNVVVVCGTNADDVDDLRPGQLAAEPFGVQSPLLDEGIGKVAVRTLARRLGLSVAEKPALACLSSRVAHGIRITPLLLERIDAAEGLVRSLGFDLVRVRHLGSSARIEVPSVEVPRLLAHPQLEAVRAQLLDLGWSEVVVAPEGYRAGSMNPSGASP